MRHILGAIALIVILLPGYAAETNSLVGVWMTDTALPNSGPSITTYSFTTNGIFSMSTWSPQGTIRPSSVTGTYQTLTNATGNPTNRLVLITNSQTNMASFHFKADTLVIDQGPSKVFTLKRRK